MSSTEVCKYFEYGNYKEDAWQDIQSEYCCHKDGRLLTCPVMGRAELCNRFPDVQEEGIRNTLGYKIKEAIDLLRDNGYVVFKEV